jgi:hypothetical protein
VTITAESIEPATYFRSQEERYTVVERNFSRTDYLGFALIALFTLWGLFLLLGKSENHGNGEGPKVDSGALVSTAVNLEVSGNIQEALTYYREAIDRKPSLCDPKSGDFLGRDFEEKINRWIRGLKNGDIENRKGALENAAYIFRKLNGGCG